MNLDWKEGFGCEFREADADFAAKLVFVSGRVLMLDVCGLRLFISSYLLLYFLLRLNLFLLAIRRFYLLDIRLLSDGGTGAYFHCILFNVMTHVYSFPLKSGWYL